MKQVYVHASKDYSVLIGSGLLADFPNMISNICAGSKVALISDSNVWPLLGEQLQRSIQDSDRACVSFTFPAGESSKNGSTYLQILEFLAENQITRSDLLVALGGGVVGDMTGFVAATYLRGVAYVQIPTTLLAMVDSSVGGKTAIDLHAGKNLAGAFYQPALVIADTDTLQTLPTEIFRDGCAEVIKYGVLYDTSLFHHLKEKGTAFDRETVIARCVELKRDVVAEDEFDTGSRQKLNLGHTFAHGIEANSNFTISHGSAVATGIAIVTKASHAFGICDEETCQEVLNVLTRFDLPVSCEFTAHQLFSSSLSDKKRAGTTINLIVPVSIGNCCIHPISVTELESFIKAGL